MKQIKAIIAIIICLLLSVTGLDGNNILSNMTVNAEPIYKIQLDKEMQKKYIMKEESVEEGECYHFYDKKKPESDWLFRIEISELFPEYNTDFVVMGKIDSSRGYNETGSLYIRIGYNHKNKTIKRDAETIVKNMKVYRGKFYPVKNRKNWEDKYLTFLQRNTIENENISVSYPNMYLIYVDNDKIPELLLDGVSEANGMPLLAIYKSNVKCTITERHGFTYIRKKNRVNISTGHMGLCSDYICSLKNGELKKIASGDYNYNEYDQNGNPKVTYYWEGKKVSKKTYNKNLKKYFDVKKASGLPRSKSYYEMMHYFFFG